MPQIFHPRMNTVSKVSSVGAVLFVLACITVLTLLFRSPFALRGNDPIEQPVP